MTGVYRNRVITILVLNDMVSIKIYYVLIILHNNNAMTLYFKKACLILCMKATSIFRND